MLILLAAFKLVHDAIEQLRCYIADVAIHDIRGLNFNGPVYEDHAALAQAGHGAASWVWVKWEQLGVRGGRIGALTADPQANHGLSGGIF